MVKNITIRTFLFFLVTLISFGWLAFYFFDAQIFAETAGQELDRLFGDMGVVKVAQVAEPVEIRLKDLNGRQVSLSDFRGKIVFLNFWTTWCPTCRIEMPSMEKLHQRFKDKEFAMVTINLRESAEQVKQFFKNFKLTFAALLDSNGEVGAHFSIYAIPTTFILDKEGRIIGKVMGPREWDSRKAFALFEHLTDSYAAVSSLK
jgi:thiol-disulfide isomerase/thioredoxin